MEELIKWLEDNKIVYQVIDKDVIEIPEMGKLYFEDTEKLNSIFRLNKDDELIFNSMEDPGVLMAEDIYYIVFKFGDNWYYTDLRGEFQLNILKYVGKRKEPVHHFEYVNLGIHTPFELLNGSFMPNMWVKRRNTLAIQV